MSRTGRGAAAVGAGGSGGRLRWRRSPWRLRQTAVHAEGPDEDSAKEYVKHKGRADRPARRGGGGRRGWAAAGVVAAEAAAAVAAGGSRRGAT